MARRTAGGELDAVLRKRSPLATARLRRTGCGDAELRRLSFAAAGGRLRRASCGEAEHSDGAMEI